ncbi:YjcZ family sporulation protein [Peribacillus sp. NPDC096447]
MSGCDGGFGFGGGFAFIVVLFILLVIVGASTCGGGYDGRGTQGYGTYC